MEGSSCDPDQNSESQNQGILSKISQEDDGCSYRQSYETIKKATKIHDNSAELTNASTDVESEDDDEDVVVQELRNRYDQMSLDQKQSFFILPYQLESFSLNQISSDKILRTNVPENSNINMRDSINITKSVYRIVSTTSSDVIPLGDQNTTKARNPNKMKLKNDIIELQPNDNVTLGETAITPFLRDALRASKSQTKGQFSFSKSQSFDTLQDSSYSNCHEKHGSDEQLCFQLTEMIEDGIHKSSLGTKIHLQNAPQQSAMKDKIFIRTAIANADSAIAKSISQKTGLSSKAQSLESRPIYPNVPYSPYASPYSSPRSNRRRTPLRESRRISIEQSGSFLQLNQYKLLDQIGQGSYGLVKLAYSEEDSTHYAMKILSKRRLVRNAGFLKRGQKQYTSPLDRVYREIAVLKKLDHPNVVKLVEVLDDPVEDSLYMVFELVKQGEVLSIPTKNPLSEERAWGVFRDTLLGLEYLHYQRIIHADIKPGNLLLTECGRVKIADLGVCNEFIGEDAIMTDGSTAGTPAFRAPETLNVGQNIYCGKAADIWALGATLYALLYGNVPFIASSVPALYEKIKTEKLCIPDIPKTSAEVKDCIQRMLKKDPGLRITLPQLKTHTWVNAGGLYPLPNEEENCRLVQIDDDDINSVVRSIPKLDTLILIKTMLKKHSFGNPFSRGISGRAPQSANSRLERFVRAGRSNSAPGTYNIVVDRQLSGDNVLPALSEHHPSS